VIYINLLIVAVWLRAPKTSHALRIAVGPSVRPSGFVTLEQKGSGNANLVYRFYVATVTCAPWTQFHFLSENSTPYGFSGYPLTPGSLTAPSYVQDSRERSAYASLSRPARLFSVRSLRTDTVSFTETNRTSFRKYDKTENW